MSLARTVGSKVKAAPSVSSLGVMVTPTDSPRAPAAVLSQARRLLQEGGHNLLNHLSQHAERRLHNEVDESCRKPAPFSLCNKYSKTNLVFFYALPRVTTSEIHLIGKC